MLSKKNTEILRLAQKKLRTLYKELPEFEQQWDFETEVVISKLLGKLGKTDPFYHPHYIGHMSGYVCDISAMSYFLTMQLNPNNHSYEGGRATTEMEIECLQNIANMIGWENHHGHLTSGGTSGNLEALWLHRENGARTIISSQAAHYTHKRMASLLAMDHVEVRADQSGRMDLTHLKEILAQWEGPPPVIVCTLGTTLTGALDPLDEIIKLQHMQKFITHIDAAYGGYFALIKHKLPERSKRVFDSLNCAESLVIDPHKHGLQGFGCGAVLFNTGKNTFRNSHYNHESPYTYLDKSGVNLGETSLECSRPGAAAAGLWSTMEALPLTTDGEFSKSLASCINTTMKISNALFNSDIINVLNFTPDLDIIVFHIKCDDIDKSTLLLQKKLKESGFHVASAWYKIENENHIDESIRCIRMTVMKKEHSEICESLYKLIIKFSEEILFDLSMNHTIASSPA